MHDAETILALYLDRAKQLSPMHVQMSIIRSIYNNEAQVDLPDMDPAPSDVPAVPNLLAQGVDQTAGRIASVVPTIAFAADKPGNRTSDRRAETARRAISAWWQVDRLMLKMRQRARHLIAYGMSPTVLHWNYRTHRPCWEVRDPMQTFPNPDVPYGDLGPPDVVFGYRRAASWLIKNGYPEVVYTLIKDPTLIPSTELLCLEYVDCYQRSLVIVGTKDNNPWDDRWQWPGSYPAGFDGLRPIMVEHADFPDIMTAFAPQRLGLDFTQGQFDSMVGMYYMQARLMALEVAAVAKGIFPDTYLISRPGEVGRFIDGPFDGRSGKVNIIAGGDIRSLVESPGYLTNPSIDRLERNARVSAGIPPEFGGESASNIRTGRRGDAVLSAQIDFPVGEAQELFAASLIQEDRAAMKLAKLYDGSAARTFYVGTGNAARPVTFVANDVFTHDEHVVSYPAAGSDMNMLLMGLGQRVGMGTMSKETAATLDPMIDSPELEHDRIIGEGLEQALVAGIQQQAAAGALPPAVVAKLIDLVKNDRLEIAPAMNRIIEDAQRAEAEQAQAQPQGAEAAMAGAAQQALAGGLQPAPSPQQGPMGLQAALQSLR